MIMPNITAGFLLLLSTVQGFAPLATHSAAIYSSTDCRTTTSLFYEDYVNKGQPSFGESQGSVRIREFTRDTELYEIVKLASRPLPDRPQGMVCVAIYTTSDRKDSNIDMAAYEMLARNYPESLFFMNTNMNHSINNKLLQPLSASQPPPTKTITTVIDVYAGGNRVAQIVENSHFGGNEGALSQLQQVLESQLQHSSLKFDLLAPTPSWSPPSEIIDAVAEEYDFESSYGNWLPNVED